jgi:hypothetical protein
MSFRYRRIIATLIRGEEEEEDGEAKIENFSIDLTNEPQKKLVKRERQNYINLYRDAHHA